MQRQQRFGREPPLVSGNTRTGDNQPPALAIPRLFLPGWEGNARVDLVRAIHVVIDGGLFLDPALAR